MTPLTSKGSFRLSESEGDDTDFRLVLQAVNVLFILDGAKDLKKIFAFVFIFTQCKSTLTVNFDISLSSPQLPRPDE